MAENYKHLYEQTKKMLTMYQDELIPGFRKIIEELEAKSKWIPVTERLPEKITNKVIVLCKNGYRGFGHYEDYKGKQTWYNLESDKPFTDWDLEDCESYEVTHWMPLPEAPTTCHMTSKQPPKGD